MITIYTVAYNEELLLQFFIDHYRVRFPNCHIVIYDNMSTDNTVKTAKQNNCETILYDTNNTISDIKYLEIKNNCWKQALTDWVLICDVDELLDINEDELKQEELLNVTMIKSCGYNMVNMEDNLDIISIKHGLRQESYDKSYLFNKKYINEINYKPGCHDCNPIGTVKYSNNSYSLFHYHFINLNYIINKYKRNAKRLSLENIKYKFGIHYLNSEEELKINFNNLRAQSKKIR